MLILQNKCHKYWPEFFIGITEYGSLEVELKEENNEEDYIVRSFTVSDHKSTSRAVIQFNYTAWSTVDGLPKDRKRFLKFVQAVRDTYYRMDVNKEKRSMIVHCRYDHNNLRDYISGHLHQMIVFNHIYVLLSIQQWCR